MRATGFTGIEDTQVLAEGWQVTDFADAGRRSLANLVQSSGTPAIMVSFLNSDVGFVEALTPDGSSWEGLLNREMAKSYEIPLEHFPIEPAIAGALAWSAAAGLTPDEEVGALSPVTGCVSPPRASTRTVGTGSGGIAPRRRAGGSRPWSPPRGRPVRRPRASSNSS